MKATAGRLCLSIGMPVPTTILYRRDGSVERELVGDVSEKRLGHYVGRIVRR